MEISIIVLNIILSMSISLGVGASTLAILNFFHAIADGNVDVAERKFMGITYKVLRIAMILILISAILLAIIGYSIEGANTFTSYSLVQAFLIFVLFLNSFLMTVRIMPSKFGPALQASTWYSLGFIATFLALGLGDFTLTTFIISYVAFVVFAIALVNGIMKHLKTKVVKTEENPTTV